MLERKMMRPVCVELPRYSALFNGSIREERASDRLYDVYRYYVIRF